MNGISPRPVCQSRCCNPSASPSRSPVSASSAHSSRSRSVPTHSRPLGSQRAHASQIASICGGVSVGGTDGRARLTFTTCLALGRLRAMCSKNGLYAPPRTQQPLIQPRRGIDPVQVVVAIQRHHRLQADRDRLLREPRRGARAIDATAGVSPERNQVRNAPKSSTLTSSHARPYAPRNSHHNASARAYDLIVFGERPVARMNSKTPPPARPPGGCRRPPSRSARHQATRHAAPCRPQSP